MTNVKGKQGISGKTGTGTDGQYNPRNQTRQTRKMMTARISLTEFRRKQSVIANNIE